MQHLRMSQAWNGRSAELAYGDGGASQAATGLLRLILDRFIHVFEYVKLLNVCFMADNLYYSACASDSQLKQLVELLLNVDVSSHTTSNTLTPSAVAKDGLRSAQLWEQRRLRSERGL